ncbi:MAG: hypothetical protein ACLGIR_01330 [Actinomycetes bacterium]
MAACTLVLAACQGLPSPTVGDSAAPQTEQGNSSDDDGGDGPVRSLTEEERTALEAEGTVLATWEEPDGVVVALGYESGDGVGVELVGVPQGFLSGASFGGGGELLLPDETCNFLTVEDGWTVVVTNEPSTVVRVEGSGQRLAVEETTAVRVGDREIGVVLVEVGHTQDSPPPSVEGQGSC